MPVGRVVAVELAPDADADAGADELTLDTIYISILHLHKDTIHATKDRRIPTIDATPYTRALLTRLYIYVRIDIEK